MPDSEGDKELAGLARSIDALFSADDDSAASTPSASPGADGDEANAIEPPSLLDVDQEAGLELPPDPPNVGGDALTGAPPPLRHEPEDVQGGASPPREPEIDAARAPDVVDEPKASAPPPLPDVAAEPKASAPPPLPDVAAEPRASAPPPLPDVADEPRASAPPPLPDVAAEAVGASAAAASSAHARPSDDDEAETTLLDLAVDAYVAGDTGRADEIRDIAADMLEKRDVEPVARAVGRLAFAAGEPPDPGTHAVVEAITTPVVLTRLARQMGAERDEARRQEYYQGCRVLGEPMAVAIRGDLAESTDRLARRVHCEALVEMGPAGRKIIEEMVVDENRFLVRNAVAILGDTGGDRAVELVTSALANPDARVRREALWSLAKLGDEKAGELVPGLLEDSDPEVRIAAAVAAGELHVERAVRPLIGMLETTSDPDEAIPLLRALGQLGDPGAVNSIEKHAVRTLFSKPRTDVRIAAYRALHQIGTPHARRLLGQALDDKEPEVKSVVMEMLDML